jgi:hypothetical protein
MRFAYADPPYLGCCRLYDHFHGDDDRCWDDPETHRLLLERLRDEYQGWAYSMSSPSLHTILPMAPGVRIGVWVKPFAAFKRNVRIAYTWEPVLWVPGRDRSDDGAPVGRDHIAVSITMRRGFTGAKPAKFCRWVLDLTGYVQDEDEFTDLYPGSNAMADALSQGVIA